MPVENFVQAKRRCAHFATYWREGKHQRARCTGQAYIPELILHWESEAGDEAAGSASRREDGDNSVDLCSIIFLHPFSNNWFWMLFFYYTESFFVTIYPVFWFYHWGFAYPVSSSRVYHPVSCLYPRIDPHGFVQVHFFRIKAFVLNSCLQIFKNLGCWRHMWVEEHIPGPKINKSPNLCLNLYSVDIITNRAAPDVQLGQWVKTLRRGLEKDETDWLLSSPGWLWICKLEGVSLWR